MFNTLHRAIRSRDAKEKTLISLLKNVIYTSPLLLERSALEVDETVRQNKHCNRTWQRRFEILKKKQKNTEQFNNDR